LRDVHGLLNERFLHVRKQLLEDKQ
jgi:hypothetical protein